jgi:hypothetical protein
MLITYFVCLVKFRKWRHKPIRNTHHNGKKKEYEILVGVPECKKATEKRN